MPADPRFSVPEIEGWMDRLYVAAEGASLRREDRRKAAEVAALLDEIRRLCARTRRDHPPVLVDAAAGKSAVGLLAARLVLEPLGRGGRVITIEREPARAQAGARAREALGTTIAVECRPGDVADPALWPEAPDLVVALHACGPAADTIIDQAIARGARHLLLAPCCTGEAVTAAGLAADAARRTGIPRHAPVRRRFIQALVDAERTWRLEAAGFETEVVEWVPATLTPHNLLWRSRRVGEPGRMAEARAALARLRGDGHAAGIGGGAGGA
jgi:hypothetical protein